MPGTILREHRHDGIDCPHWVAYPTWGRGAHDTAQVLAFLKRFGSLRVLNGHIGHVLQTIEGNNTFHTAFSTTFHAVAHRGGESPLANVDRLLAAG